MNCEVILPTVEYEELETMVSGLKTKEAPENIMAQLDKILQTVLFSSALEGGLYLDGESSFLYEFVKYSDVLREFNQNIGATLKKPVTWDGLIFLPAPGKRQILEALQMEEQKAMAALRTFLAECEYNVWEQLQGKLLEIAAIFANIDIEQKGNQIAEAELEVSRRELNRLFTIAKDDSRTR